MAVIVHGRASSIGNALKALQGINWDKLTPEELDTLRERLHSYHKQSVEELKAREGSDGPQEASEAS